MCLTKNSSLFSLLWLSYSRYWKILFLFDTSTSFRSAFFLRSLIEKCESFCNIIVFIYFIAKFRTEYYRGAWRQNVSFDWLFAPGQTVSKMACNWILSCWVWTLFYILNTFIAPNFQSSNVQPVGFSMLYFVRVPKYTASVRIPSVVHKMAMVNSLCWKPW